MENKLKLLVKDLEYLADVASQSENVFFEKKLKALANYAEELSTECAQPKFIHYESKE